MTMNDHDFDARLRGHHAQALANTSARTQAQLGRRPATVATRSRSMHAFAWPLAAACAVGILVVGLQWRQTDTAATSVSSVAASPDTVGADSLPGEGEFDAYAALDEAPDLYLWLASSDAAALAME